MTFLKRVFTVTIFVVFINLSFGKSVHNSFSIPILQGSQPPFSCSPENQEANDFCSTYCQTVNGNIVSGRCGNNPNSCICLTSDNKEITVRVVESRNPVPLLNTPSATIQSVPAIQPLLQPLLQQQNFQDYNYSPAQQQQQQQIQHPGLPVLLDCDGNAMSVHVCDTFCRSIYANYGFCNTTDRNCICFGVPQTVAQPVPIPVVFDQPIDLTQMQIIPVDSEGRQPHQIPPTTNNQQEQQQPQLFQLPQNYYMQPIQPQKLTPALQQWHYSQSQQQQSPPTVLQQQKSTILHPVVPSTSTSVLDVKEEISPSSSPLEEGITNFQSQPPIIHTPETSRHILNAKSHTTSDHHR